MHAKEKIQQLLEDNSLNDLDIAIIEPSMTYLNSLRTEFLKSVPSEVAVRCTGIEDDCVEAPQVEEATEINGVYDILFQLKAELGMMEGDNYLGALEVTFKGECTFELKTERRGLVFKKDYTLTQNMNVKSLDVMSERSKWKPQ